MSERDGSFSRKPNDSVWTSVFLLTFGMAVLIFLIAIDKQDWMLLRPATGTATAMSYASHVDAKGK